MDAVVILQRCNQNNRIFGSRTEKRGEFWYRTWAFPINEKRAHSEGYDATAIRGYIVDDPEFPGCPYCGCRGWVRCSGCQHLTCYHGETALPCNWCGVYMSNLTTIDSELDFATGSDA